MNKRKIRRHFSGAANTPLAPQMACTSGETFFDTMRRTMTQSIGKQLPSLQSKYSGPIVIDPRAFTEQKESSRKVSYVRDLHDHKLTFGKRDQSYKNDIYQIKQSHFDNNQEASKKLKDVQKALRRKYGNRNKMYSIFNGWDSQSKGYIDHKSLRTVLGVMGINLSEEQSKRFINMYSSEENKLNLNSFINIIYSSNTDEDDPNTKISQILPGDDRFKRSFIRDQNDCSLVKMQNINDLGSYQLQKALYQGQRIKNRLQKYFISPKQASEILFQYGTGDSVKFQDAKSSIIKFIKEKQGAVKWKELQGFLSLFQYNINNELSKQSLCKAIFDNESIHQNIFTRKQTIPTNLSSRKSQNSSAKLSPYFDINACIKKLDQQIFKGSASHQSIFNKFDKDKDGFISQSDFIESMKQKNIMTEDESKQVFNYLGGNKGKYQKCLSFEEFSENMKAGMGTQTFDQYPNFLQDKKVNEFRSSERMTKSDYFDPKSITGVDQRKTRFNGTPTYCYSTLGGDGTKFWGKTGDLNSKVQYQKEDKKRLSQIQKNKLMNIATNQRMVQKRSQKADTFQQTKTRSKLFNMALLKGSYEKVNHPQSK